MHGHQLRQLAEKEHIDLWTDVTVGGLYGAIKRLAAEGLIEEIRVEREGSYPERQVWSITTAGRVALAKLRYEGLTEIVFRADPFDLAVSRLDLTKLDEVPVLLNNRVAELKVLLAHVEVKLQTIERYLTPLEHHVMTHRSDRLRAEISWHEKLLSRLPELLAEELTRKASSS